MSLRIEGLRASYGNHLVLKGVDLIAETGQLTTVLGPNGSGKSTLLRAIFGQADHLSGRVHHQHKDLLKVTIGERARLVAYVPQAEAPSFPFKVVDSVLMARYPHAAGFAESSEDRQIAEAAMKEAGCSELADRPITELSGGELQRVLIARALAQQTPVILLDEPTAHLDAEHLVDFVRLLGKLKSEGKTLIAVFHDLNLAARTADQVVLMRDGEVVASGSPAQTLTAENLEKTFAARFHRWEANGEAWLYPRI
jgi:iron complex transport system ATP-binding protein